VKNLQGFQAKVFTKRNVIPLFLMIAGFLFIALEFTTNLGSYFKAILTPASQPLSYAFTTYDQILKASVKNDLVDYRQIASSTELDRQLAELEHISPNKIVNPKEQLTFWINTYNLLIIKNVVDHYPVSSIMKIGRELSMRKFVIGGHTYSASDIMDNQIKPRLVGENTQAIFCVCGGARGFPPLINHVISAQSLIEDMKNNTEKFVANQDNVLVNVDTNKFSLSPFFKWYEGLFEREYGSPFVFVNAVLAPNERVDLHNPAVQQSYMINFNWQLNDLNQKGE
jgi:hypothetical protein